MTDAQKKQLLALQEKAELNKDETKTLAELQTLAAEGINGETHHNSGFVEQFLNTTFDQFNKYTPLVMDFMKNTPELMTQPTFSMSYYLLTELVDADVALGDQPDSVGTVSRKVSIGFGKLWLKDDLLKEDLIARVNQVSSDDRILMSDGSSANPINVSRTKLLSLILRNFEKKAWDGNVNASGIGIIGIKTQHLKMNTTTVTATGSDNIPVFGVNTDGRYNYVNYTDDAAGNKAFAEDIYGRVRTLKSQFGADHFTIYVPTGAGAKLRSIFADYEKISTIVQQLITNNNGNNVDGTKVGIFSDAGGRNYINPMMDIKELDNLAAGEVYLYPDTVFGTWTYKYLEYGVAGKPLPGIRTKVAGLDKEMQDITGINPDTVSQVWFNNTSADVLELSLQWTGQIVAQAVGMATLYSRVQFVKAFPITDLSDKKTGQVNMMA